MMFADVNSKLWIKVVVAAWLEALARAPAPCIEIDECNGAMAADDTAYFRKRRCEPPFPLPLQRSSTTGINCEKQFEIFAVIERSRQTAAGRGCHRDPVRINLESDPHPASLNTPSKIAR